MNKPVREPKSAKDILMSQDFLARIDNTAKYVSKEFQDYGLRLATNLNDVSHKTLYIKLAKDLPRSKMEQAAQFALDYPNVRNRGKIFMWKLAQICKIKMSSLRKMPKPKLKPKPRAKSKKAKEKSKKVIHVSKQAKSQMPLLSE